MHNTQRNGYLVLKSNIPRAINTLFLLGIIFRQGINCGNGFSFLLMAKEQRSFVNSPITHNFI